jgi:HAD superfamily hydrolase (TIGR01459 family)
MNNCIGNISAGITRISDPFKGVLLDAYGVFWGGNAVGVLPGSKEVMEKLVSSGKIVGVLSNSTQLASKEINKLHLNGLIQGKHFHFLITSGEVARYLFLNAELPFNTPNKKFWVFGGVHPKYASHEPIFQGTCYSETIDLEEADFIYISIPHIHGEDQSNSDLFRDEIEKIKKHKLPMICSNPDRFAHEGNPPRAVVRQGTIALLYEQMGGKVFYIGKPHQKVYEMSIGNFKQFADINAADVLMVGDTPETDIRGARLFGMSSALITQTGIMADRISHDGLEIAIQNLVPSDMPNYFIERLIDDL